jgi:hypothetical protein
MATAEANEVDVEHDEQPLIRPVRLDLIRLDGGTQFRVATKPEPVDDYAEVFKAGKALPPPDVYFDGTHFWPADGHQRIAAAHKGMTLAEYLSESMRVTSTRDIDQALAARAAKSQPAKGKGAK